MMRCPHCELEIPSEQELCCRCYLAPKEIVMSRAELTEHTSRNVVFFMSDRDMMELYYCRALRYLAEKLGGIFYAENAESFGDITNGYCDGNWDLLIVDNAVVNECAEMLRLFLQNDPGIVAAVFDDGTSRVARLHGSTIFEFPYDLDSWLLAMYQLLRLRAGRPVEGQN